MNSLRTIHLTLWTVLACCAVGCSGSSDATPTYRTTGTVTLDGQPVEGADVVFLPFGDEGNPAQSKTDADGRFAMSTYVQEDREYVSGLQAGDYTATVRKLVREEGTFQPPVNQLPGKYADVPTSPLKLTVSADGENDFQLELEE